jgi:hypothetical protein
MILLAVGCTEEFAGWSGSGLVAEKLVVADAVPGRQMAVDGVGYDSRWAVVADVGGMGTRWGCTKLSHTPVAVDAAAGMRGWAVIKGASTGPGTASNAKLVMPPVVPIAKKRIEMAWPPANGVVHVGMAGLLKRARRILEPDTR